jgi:hypothetical protein
MNNIAETAMFSHLLHFVTAALQHIFGVPHPYLLDVLVYRFSDLFFI